MTVNFPSYVSILKLKYTTNDKYDPSSSGIINSNTCKSTYPIK